jgi:hypothetical protein
MVKSSYQSLDAVVRQNIIRAKPSSFRDNVPLHADHPSMPSFFFDCSALGIKRLPSRTSRCGGS